MSVLCVVPFFSSAFGAIRTVQYSCPGSNLLNVTNDYTDQNGDIQLYNNNACVLGTVWAWRCQVYDGPSSRLDRYYSPGAWVNFDSYSNTIKCAAVQEPSCGDGKRVNVIEQLLGQSIDFTEVGGTPLYQQDIYSGDPYYVNSYSYGNVGVEGMCSGTGGTVGATGTPYQYDGGGYCWCRMMYFDSQYTGIVGFDYMPWVYWGVKSGSCDSQSCASVCADSLQNDINFDIFRQSLYKTCSYDVSFTCGSVGGTPTTPTATSGYVGSAVNFGSNVTGCGNSNGSFANWYCHGTGSFVSDLSSVNNSSNGYSITVPSHDVVCDALWANDPTYHISYSCGSGASGGMPPSQTDNVYQGSSPVLPASPGTCYNNNGYAFERWDCLGDTNGNYVTVSFANNNMIIMSMPGENVSCQAWWNGKYERWALFYDCGAGSGTPPSTQYAYNTNVSLANNSCTAPAGYNFNGWMCYETDLGIFGIQNQSNLPTFESAGGTYYLGTNVTCVARWEADKPCEPGSSVSDREEILGMTISATAEDSEEWTEGITLGELFDGQTHPGIWWPNNHLLPYGLSFVGANHSWMVRIGGMCSSDVGTPGETGNPTPDANGTQCWCQATGYNPTDANPQEGEVKRLDGYPYVYLEPYGGVCSDDDCALRCVDVINGEFHWLKWQTIHTDFWSHFFHSLYTKDVCEYSINYYCNDLWTSIVYTDFALGGQPNVPLGNPCSTPNGYAFDYWDCEEASTQNSVNHNGSEIYTMPYDNVNCRAHWKQVYTLNYNCGDGTGSPWTQATYDYTGNTQNIATLTGAQASSHCTAPTGYQANVTSWNCGGQNTQVTPGNSITITGNTTCTAEWSPIKYNITYVLGDNGVYGTDHPATAFYDTVFHVSNPTRSGYTFNGWNITGMNSGVNHYYGTTNPPNSYVATTSQNFEGLNYFVEYFKNLSSIENATVTFTATWTPDATYNVSYTCGSIGGSALFGSVVPAANSSSYTAGTTNISLTSANNVNTSGCSGTGGYAFNGWKCHGSGLSNQVNNGYIISSMPAYSVICDALWEQTHTLVYDCSGCGVSSQDTPASVSIWENMSPVTLANSCFLGNAAPADIDFLGWHCMLPAGIQPYIGSSYQGGDTYSVASGNDYDTVCYGICENSSPCGNGETIYEVLGISVDNPNDNDGAWKDDNIDTGGTLTDLWNTAADDGWSGNTTTFNNYSPAPYTIEWRTMCTDNSGVPAMSGNPGSSGGQYCWCGVTNEVFYPDGSTNTLDEYPWVFAGEFADEGDCNNDCLLMCNWWLMPEWADYTGMSWFLHSLYTKTTCEYTVTYHGGSCRANASTFSDTATGGATYTVQNPRCSGSNNIVQSYLPTDGCSEFVGWSNSVSSNNVVYGSCVGGGNCSNPTTGNCGTISNVSNNVDLYAVCQSQLHNVIYHSGNCDSNDYSYTHNSVLNLGSIYTVLSPFVAPLLSQNPASLNIPQSSFQGWASSLVPAGEASWCALDSNKLYSKLVGGKTNNTSFVYQKDGKTCPDIELYAVCCPLNLDWQLNGGSWPLDGNNNQLVNQTMCEWGANAGASGSIGNVSTPLQTPIKTGYTFNGWLVTDHDYP